MTAITKGVFLKSRTGTEDALFGHANVLIAESNAEGVIGFVINKKYSRCFNELVEFVDSPPFPLNEGGPMEHEKLFFVHNRPDLISGSVQLTSEVFYGGDFSEAVRFLNMGLLDQKSLKMFIGYCGWDVGQLELEIENEEWDIIDKAQVFDGLV